MNKPATASSGRDDYCPNKLRGWYEEVYQTKRSYLSITERLDGTLDIVRQTVDSRLERDLDPDYVPKRSNNPYRFYR